MELIKVAAKITHNFSSGWSHLEKFGESFVVKVLKWKRLNNVSEYEDEKSRVTNVIAPRKVSDKEVELALYEHFSESQCRHSHDCCGCPIVSADVRKIKTRTWRVKQSVSYNY